MAVKEACHNTKLQDFMPSASKLLDKMPASQSERRLKLIRALLAERSGQEVLPIPPETWQQKRLLRSLMNVRAPKPVAAEILALQDQYLKEELALKGVVDAAFLAPVKNNLFLWQGDITRLSCDAIVNAANSGMTGCYVPCHGCIDNCIHTCAGMQLRLECAEMMARQGREEKPGGAKITGAYNLPCKYVIHTVGPIVEDEPTSSDEELLASCYQSCLAVANERRLQSIAFCCISTGVFHFPNELAAEIAVETVQKFRSEHMTDMKIIFNVFKDSDYEIYRKILERH